MRYEKEEPSTAKIIFLSILAILAFNILVSLLLDNPIGRPICTHYDSC